MEVLSTWIPVPSKGTASELFRETQIRRVVMMSAATMQIFSNARQVVRWGDMDWIVRLQLAVHRAFTIANVLAALEENFSRQQVLLLWPTALTVFKAMPQLRQVQCVQCAQVGPLPRIRVMIPPGVN